MFDISLNNRFGGNIVKKKRKKTAQAATDADTPHNFLRNVSSEMLPSLVISCEIHNIAERDPS